MAAVFSQQAQPASPTFPTSQRSVCEAGYTPPVFARAIRDIDIHRVHIFARDNEQATGDECSISELESGTLGKGTRDNVSRL